MPLYQSKQVSAGWTLPNPNEAGEETAIISEFVVPAALAVNDVIEMCGIPDGAIVTEVTLYAEACDSNGAKTFALDVGFLSGNYAKKDNTRTCDNTFAAADTTARAGGVLRSSAYAGYFQAPKNDGGTPAGNIVAGFGLKVQAGAATLVPGARLRMLVRCMPSVYGIN